MDDDDLVGQSSRFDYRWKGALFIAVVLVAVVVALTVDIPDPQPLRDRVDSAGAWGVVIFVLAYIAVSLTPFPASALTIAGGLLFGLVTGVLVVVLGATAGAWIGFWLARWLGREGVSRMGWQRVTSIDAVLQRRGLISILLIRLIPLPFALVNYAAGLSALRARDYLFGTMIGILPATIGYTALGAYGTSPLSWPFIGAICAVVVLAIASGYAAKRLRHGRQPDAASPDGPISDDIVGR